jgi:hypothetical protein
MSGLVRCPSCRDALVQPGRGACFSCRKAERPRPESEKRQERQRKLGDLVLPLPPKAAEMATHRRVQQDGAALALTWRGTCRKPPPCAFWSTST